MSLARPKEIPFIPVPAIPTHCIKARRIYESAKVYHDITGLRELLRQYDRHYRPEKPIVIRFLLDSNHNLSFGEEGSPSENVPAHCQLDRFHKYGSIDTAPTCICSGNLMFDKSSPEPELLKINHKSGDFRCDFQSLQFALRKLLSFDINISSQLEIEELNRSGAHVNSFHVERAILEEYFSGLRENEINSPKRQKVLTPPRPSPGFFQKTPISPNRAAGVVKKLSFSPE